MAAPVLRIVRRPKNSPPRTLTAASQRVDDPREIVRSSIGGAAREDWQADAWDMLDQVGELRYYVGWRASSCSRVRILASDIDEEDGLPTGGTENTRVNDIVKAIAGGALGQSQLIRRAVECLTVPGEVWVAVLVRSDGEHWLALTMEEIKRGTRGVEIELPTGEWHEYNPAVDSMFRVWNPRSRRAKDPDSPVRSTLPSLHEIVRCTKTINNASKSRLIGNGVVFVPQEMSLPDTNAPSAESDTGLVPAVEGTTAVKKLQELLATVATTAYDDEDSLAALIPLFAAVPGEQVKNVMHLKFGNDITELSIKTRNDAISRLAMGLDVSPERLLGLGAMSNHWSAWQIADEDVQLHIAPVMETICQAFTEYVLRPMLTAEGLDPEKFVVWYDAGKLTADPDKADEATNAFDRGAITAEAYRDYLGLGSDDGYDYTTMEGWQAWAQDKVSAQPELMTTLYPLLPVADEMEAVVNPPMPPALEAAPPEEEEEEEEPAPEQEQEPQTEGQPPAVAASGIVELMVARALELVGKRRRTRSDYNRLRDVPLHETHRYMGPVDEADIPKLIDGWDAALTDEALALLHIERDDLAAAVRRAVRRELTRPVVDA